MDNHASFNLKITDLKELSLMAFHQDKEIIFYTLDGESGKFQREGAILAMTFLEYPSMKTLKVQRFWNFNEVFPKIKSIYIKDIDNSKKTLIADRRHRGDDLVTVRNCVYQRPKRKKIPKAQVNENKEVDNALMAR